MTKDGAEKAVTISALIVFGTYFYRHITEGTSTKNDGGVAQLVGIGTPVNIGRFITAWGVVFFGLALLVEAAPSFGGMFAILVATGDVLANTGQVAKDVTDKLGLKGSDAAATAKINQQAITADAQQHAQSAIMSPSTSTVNH